ncbi:MAG: DegV family protein [Chloroflexota bacterium]
MPRVRIVTDSGCDLPAALLQRLAITVVPYTVRVGDRTYLDRVNITPDQFYRRLASSRQTVTVSAPTMAEYQTVYGNLGRGTNAVVSIHTSSKLDGSYAAALTAKGLISNHLRVAVIDSLSVSMGLGFLVLAAAMAAHRGDGLDEIVANVRGMILQTHVIFALETTDYMEKGGKLAKVRPVATEGGDSRPLVQLEDGMFELAERVRTRAKAAERLYEFVELFPRIEDLGVLYSTTPTDADALVKRVDTVFPKEGVVVTQYGPAVGALVGPGALGVAAYEGKGY